MRRTINRRRGQALVESALTLMIFLVTLIGIFDFGHLLYLHQALTNQIRHAARYGAVNFTDMTAIKNVVLYDQPATPADTRPGFLNLTPAMVSVTRENEGTSADRIVITITDYPFQLFSPWMARIQKMAKITAIAPVEST
jgi:Flp pilus assembly protein TadG